jgi:hypothetical protein
MTPTQTILRTMQAALLATVLTSAPSFAGTAVTPHKVPTQTQSQDQTVNGEAKKITTRGLIIGDAHAAEPTSANAQHAVVIPAIAPPVDVPPLPVVGDANKTPSATDKSTTPSYATAAAPAAPQSQQTTSSIVTLPPAPVSAYSTSVTSTDSSAATAAAPSTPVAPVVAPAPVVETQPAASTAASTTSPTVVSKDEKNSGSDTHPVTSAKVTSAQNTHARHHSNDPFQINIVKLRTQFTRFVHRPEVKSLIAAYLN